MKENKNMYTEAEVTESGSCIQKKNFPKVKYVFSLKTRFFFLS